MKTSCLLFVISFVIDIMKNYIRHRLYPQKIAENEEKNKLRTEELRNTPWAINKDGITLRGAILFCISKQ